MIQTTIFPEKTDINITLPLNYIGKKVHAIFFIDEEITNKKNTVLNKKPSDFFGILTSEEAESFEKHTKNIRKEWNRDI